MDILSKQKLRRWCETATRGIRYGPDREAVYEELHGHLTERYESFFAKGLSQEEAGKMTLSAAGDPEELAPLLAALHRPFWGYVLTASRAVLVIALVLALFTLMPYIGNQHISDRDDIDLRLLDVYGSTRTDSGGERTRYMENCAADSSDGYRFTLTRAAEWRFPANPELDLDEHWGFYFQVDVTNPRPWAEHSDIVRAFRAVDSLGNTYCNTYEQVYTYDPALIGNPSRTGLFTYTHDMWLENYRSQDAEWIDIYYDRAGRDIVLRIDLTGGDAQ